MRIDDSIQLYHRYKIALKDNQATDETIDCAICQKRKSIVDLGEISVEGSQELGEGVLKKQAIAVKKLSVAGELR